MPAITARQAESNPVPQTSSKDRILVIKLSALGDFILALGPMAAIRRHHPKASLVLLTTEPFREIAERSGYFNEIWVDERPGKFNLPGWFKVRKWLQDQNFRRVYDLQYNDRTTLYYKLLPKKGRPEWNGILRGASHEYRNPRWRDMHALDRHKEVLAVAGITDVTFPDLSWMDTDLARFSLPSDFVLLVTGAAPSRPQKRWPETHFAELAAYLVERGLTPVLLGTKTEAGINAAITRQCPEALDLTGQTSLFDIAALARHAKGAVGNDTGPMHIVTLSGCPSLVLFSADSTPEQSAPKGREVRTLQRDRLQDLPVGLVERSLLLR